MENKAQRGKEGKEKGKGLLPAKQITSMGYNQNGFIIYNEEDIEVGLETAQVSLNVKRLYRDMKKT